MPQILSYILIMFTLASCFDKKVDSKVFAQEMKARVPKRVSEGQILDEALNKGKQHIEIINKELIANLNSKKDNYKWCTIQTLFTKDSLLGIYDFEIQRVSFADSNKLIGKEKEILSAYDYSIKNKISFDENLQRIDNQTILFNQAIVLENQECIRCHTQSIDKIIPSSELKKYNPALFNLKKGNFMGMWSIKYPQSQLIVKMKQ